MVHVLHPPVSSEYLRCGIDAGHAFRWPLEHIIVIRRRSTPSHSCDMVVATGRSGFRGQTRRP